MLLPLFGIDPFNLKPKSKPTTTPVNDNSKTTPVIPVEQFKPSININPGDSVIYSSVIYTGKTENTTPNVTITNPNNTNTNQNNNNGNAVEPITNITNDLLKATTTID